jgi:hypothetical protein
MKPLLAVETERDFTTYKKGVRKCPKCGRLGRHRTYRRGGENYDHKMHFVILPGLGGGWQIDDYCFINPPKPEEQVA